MNTLILYFSGTGNSYAVAEKIGELLGNTEVIHIRNRKDISFEQYQRIGFVYPSYGTHAPKIVINLVKGIQWKETQRMFLIVTYAGSYGYAASDMIQALDRNNTNRIQQFRVKMPGSSILDYSAFPMFMQHQLLKSADKKLSQICTDIIQENKTKKIKPNLLAVLFQKSGNKMVENYSKRGSLFYTEETCIHCGKCAAICASNNITVTKEYVKWNNQCSQCMACIQWCPRKAIRHPALTSKRKRYHHPNVNIIQDKDSSQWYSYYQR